MSESLKKALERAQKSSTAHQAELERQRLTAIEKEQREQEDCRRRTEENKAILEEHFIPFTKLLEQIDEAGKKPFKCEHKADAQSLKVEVKCGYGKDFTFTRIDTHRGFRSMECTVYRSDRTEDVDYDDYYVKQPIAITVKTPEEGAEHLADWFGKIATPDMMKQIAELVAHADKETPKAANESGIPLAKPLRLKKPARQRSSTGQQNRPKL